MDDFLSEIMAFLTPKDISELEEKAGVKFPLKNPDWETMCYICTWMRMFRDEDLPGNLHNRMVLGESNLWTKIYMRNLETRRIHMVLNPYEIKKLFELAG